MDRERQRIGLSRKRLLPDPWNTVTGELQVGRVEEGTVTNVVDFGAFVDLGGVDGLLHISQLSWDFVEHPRDVLSVGDEVEVYVLGVDRERERISLSRKHLLPPEWAGSLQAEPVE